MLSSQHICDHAALWPTDQPSPNATLAKYKPLTLQQRFTAATGSRKGIPSEDEFHANLFPLPLVLPGDELASDPRYPPQSFSSWQNEQARNELTSERKTVYVANYPSISSGAPRDHHRRTTPHDWTRPKLSAAAKASLVQRPELEDVLGYLQAFFHDLPVRKLPGGLEIGSWLPSDHKCEPKRKKNSQVCVCEVPESVEIRSPSNDIGTRVRVRHLHENEQCSPYQTQLNLNDLLDHAIAVLPEDAYCLLMLVDHDLYEDDEDDFCCGRAYGGSRIAVVSSSQYQPALDKWHSVDLSRGHNWPGSHCRTFVESACSHGGSKKPASERTAKRTETIGHEKQAQGTSVVDAIMIDDTIALDEGSAVRLTTPLQAAVSTHHRLQSLSSPSATKRSSYLRRVGLTASHELLHCFGLDHCIYYACAMQGTSSIAEDSRQPPYLCPVCENKLARATSKVSSRKVHAKALPNRDWWASREIRDWKRGRNEAMLAFCRTRGDEDLAFAPLAAWLEALMQIEDAGQQ